MTQQQSSYPDSQIEPYPGLGISHPLHDTWDVFGDGHVQALLGRVTSLSSLGDGNSPSRHTLYKSAIVGHVMHNQHARDVRERTNLNLLDLTPEQLEEYKQRAGKPEFVPDNVIFLHEQATRTFSSQSNPLLDRVRKITLELLGTTQSTWQDTKTVDEAIWYLPQHLSHRDSEASIQSYDYDEDFAINDRTKYSAWPIYHAGGLETTPENLMFIGVQRRRAILDYRSVQVFKESRGLIVMETLPPVLRKRLARVMLNPQVNDDEEEMQVIQDKKMEKEKQERKEENHWAVATAGLLFFNASRLKNDSPGRDQQIVVLPTGVKILASALKP